ncbi:MAG: signal peptidase I [Candidatus Limnocylindrales bacterium]
MRRASATGGSGALGIVVRLVDLALIAIVAVGLSSVVIGRVLPLLGHPVYVVAGPSMEPAIGIGSVAILDRVPSTELTVGDVVSLRSGAGRAIFTHRIIRLADRDGERWLETQGDANAAPDPSISPASAVIGRVAWSLPVAGYLIALLSTLPGLVMLVSTGALLLVVGWWLDGLAVERRRSASVVDRALAPLAAPPPGPRRRRTRPQPRASVPGAGR